MTAGTKESFSRPTSSDREEQIRKWMASNRKFKNSFYYSPSSDSEKLGNDKPSFIPFSFEDSQGDISDSNSNSEEIDSEDKDLDPIEKIQQLMDKLEGIVEERRSNYADRIAADHRRFFGRFLKSDTRMSGILKKIPFLRTVADTINRKIDDARREDSVDDLRADYEDALKTYIEYASGDDIANIDPEKSSDNPDNVRARHLMLLINEDALLESAICKSRQSGSKKATRFSSWWMRQGGIVGTIKKGAVVIGAGIVAGATIATGGLLLGVGTAMLTPLSGGLAGFGVAKHVTDRQANSFIDKSRTKTIAEQESDRAQESNSDILHREVDEGSLSIDKAVSIISGSAERNANEAMKKNRNRYRTLVALGTLGAEMGGIIVDSIDSWFTSSTRGSNLASTGNNSFSKDSYPPEGPSSPTSPIQGSEFTVEPGNGLTNELQEFAQLNGKELTPEQAWRLHVDLVDRFGSYLDGVGTYQMGPGPYDIGISSPGYASLRPEVAEFIMNWIAR